MAKAKQPRSKKGNKAKRPRKVRQSMAITPYQSLLADPCTSTLHSPYGGERGMVERFVNDVTLGAAGNTAGVIFVAPAFNIYGGFSAVNSSTATVTTSSAAVAGTFFTANVQKARPIACCLELIPSSLSITNITGELAMSVFDSTTVGAGANYTVDGIFALTNDREVIQKRDYECKWYPGSADSLYNTRNNGLLISAEPASQNEVVIAWRGVPAGTLFSFRITIVYEWTAVPGLGLATSSAPGYEIDWKNQSADLHRKDPNWWKEGSSSSLRGNSAMAGSGFQGFSARMAYAAKQGLHSRSLHDAMTDPSLLVKALGTLF